MDRVKAGKRAKRRGYTAEKWVLEQLKEEGYEVYRTPASGGGKYVKGDIVLKEWGHIIEVKSRQDKNLIRLIEFVNENRLKIFNYKKVLITSINDIGFFIYSLNKKQIIDRLEKIYTSATLDKLIENSRRYADFLIVKNNDNKKNKAIVVKLK